MEVDLKSLSAGLLRASSRLNRWLFWPRMALLSAAVVVLGMIPVVAAHRYRKALWLAPMPPINTPAELIGIVLFLPDLGIAGLLVIQLLRLLISPSVAVFFFDTIEQIILRRGGVWWITLVVWMGAGTFWAGEPALAQYETLHAAALLGMAFVLASYIRSGYARAVLLVCVTGMVLHAALTLVQFLHGNALGLTVLGETQLDTLWRQGFRAYGLTDNPNSLGGYLMVGLFAALALASQGKRWWAVILPVVGAGMIAGGLLVTFSRGAIGATLPTLLLVTCFGPRLGTFRIPRWAMGLLLVTCAVILIALTVVLWERIETRINEAMGPSEQKTEQGYFLNRNFYTTDTNTVIRHSSVWGVGSNNLMREISFIYTAPFYDRRYPVHNVYWVVRAENGIPGLILFGLACASVLGGLRRPQTPAFIWACAFWGICLVMLVEFYFWSSHHSRALVFFVLGMYWGSSLETSPGPATLVIQGEV